MWRDLVARVTTCSSPCPTSPGPTSPGPTLARTSRRLPHNCARMAQDGRSGTETGQGSSKEIAGLEFEIAISQSFIYSKAFTFISLRARGSAVILQLKDIDRASPDLSQLCRNPTGKQLPFDSPRLRLAPAEMPGGIRKSNTKLLRLRADKSVRAAQPLRATGTNAATRAGCDSAAERMPEWASRTQSSAALPRCPERASGLPLSAPRYRATDGGSYAGCGACIRDTAPRKYFLRRPPPPEPPRPVAHSSPILACVASAMIMLGTWCRVSVERLRQKPGRSRTRLK